MDKYCAQRQFTMFITILMIIVAIISKVLTLCFSNFNVDQWQAPEIFQLLNLGNCIYYGGIAIVANAAIVVSLNMKISNE